MKITSVFLTLLIFVCSAHFVGGQLLTMLDKRSLKGKIDHNNRVPIVVVFKADDSFEFNKKKLDRPQLLAEIDSFLDYRSPETRTIYIQSDGATSFSKIAEFMKLCRKLGEDDFAFVLEGKSDLEVLPKLKIVIEEPSKLEPKPGKSFLGVEILKEDKLALNKKPVTTKQLVANLKATFAARKKNKQFRLGSREVEKTVFVKPLLSTSFESVITVVNNLNSVGAYPIAITVDWLKP